MTSESTCSDYMCEWDGLSEHSHTGVRPYLRHVINPEGKLIDGRTGELPVVESDDSKSE